MNRFLFRSRPTRLNSFTLIELLVVIAIIAILAAVILTVGGSAIRTAQRAKAANMATQLQTAAMGYYTEYSVYPVVSATTPVDILYSTQTQWQPITVCLCGGIDPGNPGAGQYSTQTISNNRQIAFITFNAADLDTTVAPAVPKTPFTILGAKGYYQMAIDADYSGIVGDSGTGTQPPNFATLGSTTTAYPITTTKSLAGGVAVWANCDPNTTATSTHPNFWVHTY